MIPVRAAHRLFGKEPRVAGLVEEAPAWSGGREGTVGELLARLQVDRCLLYTSDAADEEDSVDPGGRRIIKKKNTKKKKKNIYLLITHILSLFFFFFFFFFKQKTAFFFSSRRRHTRFLPVSWARRCV